MRRDMTCVPYKYDKDLNQEIDMGVTGMGAVSYTHLDVYKRQSLRRDVIDQRIVREVKNGTYTYIGSKPEEDGKAKQLSLIHI